MAVSQKFIPLMGVNVDLAPARLGSDKAAFIKNLVYSITDTADGGKSRGADTGIFKTEQANDLYIKDFKLPEGDNYCIGALSSKETKQVFVWIYNSNKNHTIYVLNGENQTLNILSQGSHLNLQLQPENFIHVGGAALFVLYITDPDTGEKVRKSFLSWADNHNPDKFTCVEDAISTGGYDPTYISYFDGDYDRDIFFSVGVAPDQNCIGIEEVPITEESKQKNNKMSLNTWQFRTRWIDVWGRPSDWSIISDLYIPGINDCLSSSSNISRCVNLIFSTPPPNIDKVEIAYRNCNSQQWYKADTLDLYKGSPLGEWWKRTRNEHVDYNTDGSAIVYTFCADRECAPISPAETSRLFNPIPNKSVGVAAIGKVFAYNNNEYGFNPVPQSEKDKITITVDAPDTPTQVVGSRSITIYIPIYNIWKENFQQVFKDGTLGYSWGDNNDGHGGARAYSQYFSNPEQQGFCGYLVGGPSAISTQVYVAGGDELVDDVSHNGIALSQLKYNGSGYTMQKFTFTNIPAGVYVFRLASHLSNPDTDVNYRKTSTTVWGLFGLQSGKLIPTLADKRISQELVINVCESDYNTLSSGEMLVIADLAAFKDSILSSYRMYSRSVCGYVTESPDGPPVELMRFGLSNIYGHTDHNGFYYVTMFADSNYSGVIADPTFVYKCTPIIVRKILPTPGKFGMWFQNLTLDGIDGSRYSDYSSIDCNRVIIKGRLTVQGTDIGIPNAEVVLTRGAVTSTDSNGNFTIIAHDDISGNPRRDQLIVANGSCRYYTEGSPCIAPISITIYRCTVCSGERVIDVGTTYLLSYLLQRGLLSGGTYAVGFALKDAIDRSTFVQDLGYITIPTVQETQIFSPSQVRVNISNDISFDPKFKSLVFYISEETTIQDYITWIVDDVEFVDNSGAKNASNPTQIKIYYGSLIEFNKQNNYNTTTDWAFINTGTEDSPLDMPYTNDNVVFLVNGDGKFFEKSITARVKYARDGQYFLINYTEDLKDLKPNAFIRLYSPKACETSEVMYELCNPIKLVDGKPQTLELTLNAFDTYYINREIPVPVPQPDGEDVDTVNETRIFAYPFEHHSPSDFWGYRCKNIGRANVKNPYEAVLYKQDEIALTGSFSNSGYINFLSYFEEGYSALGVASRKVEFDKSGFQGIVSLIPQVGIVLIIGQYNNATVGFNDNLLRMSNSGTITVPSAQDTFGQPNVNPDNNYGCILFDKNSIAEYEGNVYWVDTANTVVTRHNFRLAEPVSKLSCDSYIRAKIKEVQGYNLTHDLKRYFVGCASPLNAEYILSDKKIGDKSYFNALREWNVTAQETIAFDMYSGLLKEWKSYTPEYYSTLKGEKNDQQLFSFKNGIPYFHYTSISDNMKWGTFYGIPAERVVEVVVNMDDIKKKKSLSASVYSHHLYFIDRILTEASQESWVPVEYWKQGNWMWSAPLLCDLNTPYDPNVPQSTGVNKLTDGDMLYGTWIKIRFVGRLEDNTKYTELTGFTVDVSAEEKSGL